MEEDEQNSIIFRNFTPYKIRQRNSFLKDLKTQERGGGKAIRKTSTHIWIYSREGFPNRCFRVFKSSNITHDAYEVSEPCVDRL